MIIEKLSLARSMGATAGINGKKENVTSQLMSLTGGRGVDVVIEALVSITIIAPMLVFLTDQLI
jgi:threonine dehydrogenase-like Zn-dependent dehydrogenase